MEDFPEPLHERLYTYESLECLAYSRCSLPELLRLPEPPELRHVLWLGAEIVVKAYARCYLSSSSIADMIMRSISSGRLSRAGTVEPPTFLG
jgi:hypothetical protein